MQNLTNLLATVTAYKEHLVLELKAKSSSDEVVTTLDNPNVFGQIIMDSGKNLGVSPQALQLLKTVRRGSDSLGDLDWFQSLKGDTFGWVGGPFRIANPAEAEGSRQYEVLSHVVIANEPAQGAMDAIDKMLAGASH